MKLFPIQITDEALIAVVNQWAALLEREDYQGAYVHTAHVPDMDWRPDLIRRVIKDYGNAETDQRVTVHGEPTDITQRKEVVRWEPDLEGRFGEIWYDLDLNGYVCDLTATFELRQTGGGITVHLNDIHVM